MTAHGQDSCRANSPDRSQVTKSLLALTARHSRRVRRIGEPNCFRGLRPYSRSRIWTQVRRPRSQYAEAWTRTSAEVATPRILSSIESCPPASKPKGIVGSPVRVSTLDTPLTKPLAVKTNDHHSHEYNLRRCPGCWISGDLIPGQQIVETTERGSRGASRIRALASFRC